MNDGPSSSTGSNKIENKISKELRSSLELKLTSGKPETLIVTLAAEQSGLHEKGRLDAIREVSSSVLRDLGKALLKQQTFSRLPMMVVEIDSKDALGALLAHPAVKSVEANRTFHLSSASTMNLIGQQAAANVINGAGGTGDVNKLGADSASTPNKWRVAVLDSSIDTSNGATYWGGNCGTLNTTIASGATGGTGCAFAAKDSIDLTASSGPDTSDVDPSNHGKVIAGVIREVAPAAEIVAIDVIDTVAGVESTTTAVLLAGLNKVIALADPGNTGTTNTGRIAAVNLSLASADNLATGTCDAGNTSLKNAIQSLRTLGIPTIVSAGNNRLSDRLPVPACLSNVVSVASVYDATTTSVTQTVEASSTTTTTNNATTCQENGAANKVLCNANVAPELSLFAPGYNITAAGVTKTGSSVAAAHVSAAAVALRAANNNDTVERLVKRMTSNSTTATRNGVVKPVLNMGSAADPCAGPVVRDVPASGPASVISSLSFASDDGGSGLPTPGLAPAQQVDIEVDTTNCSVSNAAGPDWVTITSGSPAVPGPRTFRLAVQPDVNTGALRSSTITFAQGASVSVSQNPDGQQPVGSISTVLDSTNAGQVTGGYAYTKSTTVNVTFTGVDDNIGVTQVCLTTSSTATAATCTPYKAYASPIAFALPALQGPYNVYAFFRDGRGNTSSAAMATTPPYYDGTLPTTGSILDANNAVTTTPLADTVLTCGGTGSSVLTCAADTDCQVGAGYQTCGLQASGTCTTGDSRLSGASCTADGQCDTRPNDGVCTTYAGTCVAGDNAGKACQTYADCWAIAPNSDDNSCNTGLQAVCATVAYGGNTEAWDTNSATGCPAVCTNAGLTYTGTGWTNGSWAITAGCGSNSACACDRPTADAVCASTTYFDNTEAQASCPAVCAAVGRTFNGQWTNGSWAITAGCGSSSACSCTIGGQFCSAGAAGKIGSSCSTGTDCNTTGVANIRLLTASASDGVCTINGSCPDLLNSCTNHDSSNCKPNYYNGTGSCSIGTPGVKFKLSGWTDPKRIVGVDDTSPTRPVGDGNDVAGSGLRANDGIFVMYTTGTSSTFPSVPPDCTTTKIGTGASALTVNRYPPSGAGTTTAANGSGSGTFNLPSLTSKTKYSFRLCSIDKAGNLSAGSTSQLQAKDDIVGPTAVTVAFYTASTKASDPKPFWDYTYDAAGNFTGFDTTGKGPIAPTGVPLYDTNLLGGIPSKGVWTAAATATLHIQGVWDDKLAKDTIGLLPGYGIPYVQAPGDQLGTKYPDICVKLMSGTTTPTCVAADWKTYTTSGSPKWSADTVTGYPNSNNIDIPITLPTGEGTFNYAVFFRDAALNVSGPFIAPVTHDTATPQGGVVKMTGRGVVLTPGTYVCSDRSTTCTPATASTACANVVTADKTSCTQLAPGVCMGYSSILDITPKACTVGGATETDAWGNSYATACKYADGTRMGDGQCHTTPFVMTRIDYDMNSYTDFGTGVGGLIVKINGGVGTGIKVAAAGCPDSTSATPGCESSTTAGTCPQDLYPGQKVIPSNFFNSNGSFVGMFPANPMPFNDADKAYKGQTTPPFDVYIRTCPVDRRYTSPYFQKQFAAATGGTPDSTSAATLQTYVASGAIRKSKFSPDQSIPQGTLTVTGTTKTAFGTYVSSENITFSGVVTDTLSDSTIPKSDGSGFTAAVGQSVSGSSAVGTGTYGASGAYCAPVAFADNTAAQAGCPAVCGAIGTTFTGVWTNGSWAITAGCGSNSACACQGGFGPTGTLFLGAKYLCVSNDATTLDANCAPTWIDVGSGVPIPVLGVLQKTQAYGQIPSLDDLEAFVQPVVPWVWSSWTGSFPSWDLGKICAGGTNVNKSCTDDTDCPIDSTTNATCTAEGKRTVYYYFMDAWFNKPATPKTATVIVDTSTPTDVAIRATAALNSSNQGVNKVSWDAATDTNGIAGYRLLYTVSDTAGETSPAAGCYGDTKIATVQTASPGVYQVNTTTSSGATVLFALRGDGNPVVDGTANNPDGNPATSDAIAYGKYINYLLCAKDKAGKWSEGVAFSIKRRNDITVLAPSVSLVSAVAGQFYKNTTTGATWVKDQVKFRVTASDTSGIVGACIKTTNDATGCDFGWLTPTAAGVNSAAYTLPGVNGEKNFWIFVKDGMDNVSTGTLITVSKDTGVGGVPKAGTFSADTSVAGKITLNIGGFSDPFSGLKQTGRYKVYYNTGTTVAGTCGTPGSMTLLATTNTSPVTHSPTTKDQAYSYLLCVYDNVGNVNGNLTALNKVSK